MSTNIHACDDRYYEGGDGYVEVGQPYYPEEYAEQQQAHPLNAPVVADERDTHIAPEELAGVQTRWIAVSAETTLGNLLAGKDCEWALSPGNLENLRRVIATKDRSNPKPDEVVGDLRHCLLLKGSQVTSVWNDSPVTVGVNIPGFTTNAALTSSSAHTLVIPPRTTTIAHKVDLDDFENLFSPEMYDRFSPMVNLQSQVTFDSKKEFAHIKTDSELWAYMCARAEVDPQWAQAVHPSMGYGVSHVAIGYPIAKQAYDDACDHQERIRSSLLDLNRWHITFHAQQPSRPLAPVGLPSDAQARYKDSRLAKTHNIGFMLKLVYCFADPPAANTNNP